MDVSISRKEFDAINFAIDQIRSAIEGAEDEEYIKSACEAEEQLYSILEKYKRRTEYVRLNNLADQTIRRHIKQNPGSLREFDLRKLKKKLIETWKNE